MDEGYSKSGLATMEDVQEWLMQGLEMVVSRDEVFTQEMEALNAKKCELVEAQLAREKKLKAAKDNLMMLENVRREKEIEVMKLHQVFASLPKNLLQAVAQRAKDMVNSAGDSYGVKRKWRDFDQLHEERKEQMRQPSTPTNEALTGSQFSYDSKYLYGSRDQTDQPSTKDTPINRVPPRSQPQFSHDSYMLKRTWGESQHMFKSGDQPSTPINKVLGKSQSELSHDSYIMKRKLMESNHLYGRSGDQKRQPSTQGTPINKVPPRSQPQLFSPLSCSTPINKVLSRSQSQLSQDSYSMKRKLVKSKHLYGSSRDQMRQPYTPGNKMPPQSQPNLSHDDSNTRKRKLEEWGKRQLSTPKNKVLPRRQPQFSHDDDLHSLSSDLKADGDMQVLPELLVLAHDAE